MPNWSIGQFQEYLKPQFLWLLAGVLMLIMEFWLPGLVIVFFGLGACIVAAVCAITVISVNTQLILFIVFSVLLLATLRRWVKAIFIGHTTLAGGMSDRQREFIGQRARVTKTITPRATGRVEFHGTEWDARADQTIEEGAMVEICGQSNITLDVKPLM
jgi:inner membrane protein